MCGRHVEWVFPVRASSRFECILTRVFHFKVRDDQRVHTVSLNRQQVNLTNTLFINIAILLVLFSARNPDFVAFECSLVRNRCALLVGKSVGVLTDSHSLSPAIEQIVLPYFPFLKK